MVEPIDDSWKKKFKKALSRWEVMPSQEALDNFEVYLSELRQWNEKINLTALTEPSAIALGHFVDSLSPLTQSEVFESSHAKAVDIGTGAGFPGLPLKILKPHWHITLVESVNKKSDFLRAVTGAMELNHVEIITQRVEDLGWDKDHRGTYDFAFARALSNLSTLIEYGLPLLKIGGLLIAHRGRTAAEEATRVSTALQELGGEVTGVHHYDLPEIGGSRALVCIKKTQATSKHYPRRIGVAVKRPL